MEIEPTIRSEAGQPTPLGSSVTDSGINFAIFSRHAERVWLLLFDRSTDAEPSRVVELNPTVNRTGDIWHIRLMGLGHGQLYLYRMDGPYLPLEGHRFNRHKPLLDPYARAITGDFTWDLSQSYSYQPDSPEVDLSFSNRSSLGGMPKCVAYGNDGFDWQGDRPLRRPLNETIIYETHVRSLTCHKSAQVEYPGTFRGVVEKIPYFKDLGVTAIELLPIHLFYPEEFDGTNPLTGQKLQNYWGYNSLAFFAPHNGYSHLATDRGQQVVAFKEMVRALHQAGLEVILDVVFNHTVEGDQRGQTLSFRGIANSIYYLLEDEARYYKNFSGVGNTVACNHPVVRDFIIDCLRYWVQEMHVDGFRFDLATILSRDRWGYISGNPALPARIAEDPILRHSKIIAEPWDVGGYQVGHFPGGRWAEWNDQFRDDIRRFWRGDPGLTSALATRLAGSADLYYQNGRTPNHSINFVTAHDGFTLNDLVSYNQKHNEANGEEGRDGHNNNLSFNYGHEGPTGSPEIEAIRKRQIKNFFTLLLLSQGTPMINGGDEFRRTQAGNNNAFCQDNEISWYDWSFLKKHADIYRFVKELIKLRQSHPIFRRTAFFTGLDLDDDQFLDIHWFDPSGNDTVWDSQSKQLMATMDGSKEETRAEEDDVDVLLMFNAAEEEQLFYLPSPPHDANWWLVIDTSQPSPQDIRLQSKTTHLKPNTVYNVKPRSLVVMFSSWKRSFGSGTGQDRGLTAPED